MISPLSIRIWSWDPQENNSSKTYDVFFPTFLLLLLVCMYFCIRSTAFISRNTNYGNLMMLCPFTAFLRTPFSNSDFLHYLLRYVFEEQESRISKVPLQHISKKNRLRYEGKICMYRRVDLTNLVNFNYSDGTFDVSTIQEEKQACWFSDITWMWV